MLLRSKTNESNQKSSSSTIFPSNQESKPRRPQIYQSPINSSFFVHFPAKKNHSRLGKATTTSFSDDDDDNLDHEFRFEAIAKAARHMFQPGRNFEGKIGSIQRVSKIELF